MVFNFAVSAITVILGAFITASPARAVKIWGSDKLARLTPAQSIVFVRWFRVLGVLICVAGILFAIDSIGFANYHR
jgi:hypothetical protein